jgi:hypothetical protein
MDSRSKDQSAQDASSLKDHGEKDSRSRKKVEMPMISTIRCSRLELCFRSRALSDGLNDDDTTTPKASFFDVHRSLSTLMGVVGWLV